MKIFNKIWALALITVIFTSYSLHADDNKAWNDLDRIGLYNSIEDGQIVRNIWENYTQEEAITLLERLPDTLRSPVYRDVVKRLLLSTAKSPKENVDSPALLAKRLSLLIRYGLFEDAQSLYDVVVKKNTLSQDYDLALIGLQLTMLDGDIAPICLDVEAFSEQFRDMPGWRELSTFCQLRFGSNDKISVKATTFKNFPILKGILTSETISLSNNKSTFDVLAVYADHKIDEKNYNRNAQKLTSLNDIAVALAVQPRYKTQKTYQCYAIEAVARGIKDVSFLKESYKSHDFPQELLDNDGGDVTLHPCDIPAFFYQKLQLDNTKDDTTALVTAMLEVTKDIPAIALTPMHDHLFSVTQPSHQWRSAFIQMFSGENISEFDSVTNLPLDYLANPNRFNKNDYKEWYADTKNKNMLALYNVDPASVLYILSILNGDINKLEGKNKNINYENFFSLTYGEKSLGLGLGFNDYIAQNYSDDNHAAALIKMIALVGNIQPQEMHLSDIAVILSALKAYKLEKNAIMLSFEYLQ